MLSGNIAQPAVRLELPVREAIFSVRVHMLLLDHSQYAHVAPNIGIPCNTYTIMYAALYVLHTRPATLKRKPCWVLDDE